MTHTPNLYFDNAATSFPKAPGVAETMQSFIAKSAANPGRAGHTMAVNAEKMLDEARLKLTRFFSESPLDPNRLIFSMNCTDALNMAIKGITPPFTEENGNTRVPNIVTTILEHNSVSRVLEAMRRDGQITLTRIDCNDEGFVDPQAFEQAITEDTVLFVMTHASNVLGTIQDVAAIGAIARKYGIYFCLDAAQTAGCVPIDIEKMNVDLLAFPGHKSLLGPTGTGGLYIGPRCPDPSESCVDTMSGYELGSCETPEAQKLEPVRQIRMASYIKMKPWREGGSGGDSTDITQPASYPYYLEGGTPNTVGIAGLNAAMNYFDDHKVQDILDHEQQLVAQLIEGIGELPGCRLLGTAGSSKRVGTVSFTMDQYKPGELAAILNDHFDIAVRAGLHCAPYTHRRYGTFPDGAVRVSPGPFHEASDIESILSALKQIAGN